MEKIGKLEIKESLDKNPKLRKQIHKYQDEYYSAIATSNSNGNLNVFIEFMLKMIDETLSEVLKEDAKNISIEELSINRLLDVMKLNVPMTANEIMEKLNIKSKETFRKNYLDIAISAGKVKLLIPDKPTSKSQMYYKVSE